MKIVKFNDEAFEFVKSVISGLASDINEASLATYVKTGMNASIKNVETCMTSAITVPDGGQDA